MAKKSDKGTYLKVEVNLWYDKRAGNFHITTSDPDFAPSGMHCTLRKGTVSESSAKAAFALHEIEVGS